MYPSRKILASVGWPLRLAITASFMWILLGIGALTQASAQTSEQDTAQTAEAPTAFTAPVVPQQVRFAGKLANRAGDTVEAEFRIYATAEGGEPLWTETQRVTLGEDGTYTVLLGAASPTGLPQTVFAGGVARWLGISVERSPELDRVMLASVPYAMKSADAEALAGHAAADFVTQEQLAQLTTQGALPASSVQPDLLGTVTGAGTVNTIPLWTGAYTQGNSAMTQVAGEVGIFTATPAATLDVNGTAIVRSTFSMPAPAATTTAGGTSARFNFSSTAWSSTLAASVVGNFSLVAEPTGNNTANPSSNLFFRFQNGTNPVANLFSIGGNGVIGFNAAQTFPGTIKSVAATSPVTAATTSGAVTVGLNTTALETTLNGVYAQLGAANTFTKPITFAPGQTFPGGGGGTITGITTSSPLTGSGTSGSVALGLNTSALLPAITPPLETTFNGIYAQLGASNIFSGTLTATASSDNGAIIGNGTMGVDGVYGTTDTGNAIYGTASGTGSAGYFINDTTASAAVYAENDATGNPGLGIALKGYVSNASSIAVLGKAVDTASYGVFGENVGGTDGWGVYGNATGPGSTAIYGMATGGADGNNVFGNGVVGVSSGGNGVEGSSQGASTIGASLGPAGSIGVWGDVGNSGAGGAGILGTADGYYAAFLRNNGASPTLVAFNFGAGPAASLDGHTTYQESPTLGVENSSTGGAAEMDNDSNSAVTLYLSNNGTGGIIDDVSKTPGHASEELFKTLMASTPTGTCGIGDGDLSCTGQVKALVSTGGGTRKVETYAPQSAENWMEDYGTGAMQLGVAVVKIDPAFAETATETPDYHVFLTPNADSKGLYVINKTLTTFEVRESGGGTSSLTFDYKIVARRRGYEAQRLRDVTESFNAAKARAEQSHKSLPNPALQMKGRAIPAHARGMSKTAEAIVEAPEREVHPAHRSVPGAKPGPATDPRH